MAAVSTLRRDGRRPRPAVGPRPSRAAVDRRPGDGRLVAVVWAALTVWALGWAWVRRAPSGISWHYFTDGVHWLLVTDGLHLYAHHPQLQVGPLTLVAVAPATALPPAAALAVVQVVGTAVGLLALWAATLAAPRPVPWWVLLVAGAVMLPAWTVLSVRWVHPDDVLAVGLAVCAMAAVRYRNGVLAGLLLGAAVAAKPWAIGFEPVLLMLPRDRALKGLAAGATVVAAAWLPFLLGDFSTLTALHPPIAVGDTSVLQLFGITGTQIPAWIRPVQLLSAPVVAYLVVRRGRWLAVPLVAFAVRLAIDPHDIGYYEGAAVTFAVLADLRRLELPRLAVPWWTLGTAVVMWHPFVTDFARRDQLAGPLDLFWFDHPTGVAWLHLAWALTVVLGHLLPPAVRGRRVRVRSAQ
jgi:hypothetical protein